MFGGIFGGKGMLGGGNGILPGGEPAVPAGPSPPTSGNGGMLPGWKPGGKPCGGGGNLTLDIS